MLLEGVLRISEKVSAEEIQSLARDLQLLRNQIQTVSSQASEYSITIEALANQDPGRPVFRSLGNLLLEVDDRESLKSELKEMLYDTLLSGNPGIWRFIRREAIEEMAKNHQSGRRDNSQKLWSLLVLQNWMDCWDIN